MKANLSASSTAGSGLPPCLLSYHGAPACSFMNNVALTGVMGYSERLFLLTNGEMGSQCPTRSRKQWRIGLVGKYFVRGYVHVGQQGPVRLFTSRDHLLPPFYRNKAPVHDNRLRCAFSTL